MKTLHLPALLGTCLLTLLPLAQTRAQMPFTGAPSATGNSYQHPNYGSAPSFQPPVAAATPVQGGAYGANANGIPGAGYPPTGYSGEAIDPNHKLRPGDRLSYRVVEDRDPTVIPLVVTDSGDVDVPIVNLIKAANLTAQQLTANIKARLEQDYYYHATVVLNLDAIARQASRGTAYISGAVAGAGAVQLPLDAQLTVSQAIGERGGFKDFGDQRHVRVIRKGGPPKGFIIDVKAVQQGDTSKDFELQPGDQIFVPEKRFNL